MKSVVKLVKCTFKIKAGQPVRMIRIRVSVGCQCESFLWASASHSNSRQLNTTHSSKIFIWILHFTLLFHLKMSVSSNNKLWILESFWPVQVQEDGSNAEAWSTSTKLNQSSSDLTCLCSNKVSTVTTAPWTRCYLCLMLILNINKLFFYKTVFCAASRDTTSVILWPTEKWPKWTILSLLQ